MTEDGVTSYCSVLVDEAAVSVTLSIKGGASVKVKKIAPEYLPDSKQITITIEKNGNDVTVTSDTPFAEAWAMTPGELQQAIVIKETSNYKGETYTTVETVAKVNTSVIGSFISLRVRQSWIDTSDFGDRDNTRYIAWNAGGCSLAQEQLNGLPMLNAAQKNMYLRWGGSSWQPVTIDQLKADLGLT
jgi:hypothetical protein